MYTNICIHTHIYKYINKVATAGQVHLHTHTYIYIMYICANICTHTHIHIHYVYMYTNICIHTYVCTHIQTGDGWWVVDLYLLCKWRAWHHVGLYRQMQGMWNMQLEGRPAARLPRPRCTVHLICISGSPKRVCMFARLWEREGSMERGWFHVEGSRTHLGWCARSSSYLRNTGWQHWSFAAPICLDVAALIQVTPLLWWKHSVRVPVGTV
jgi:hypothetical protein